MIRATVQFYTGSPYGWYVTKMFKDEEHIDNFIAYIKRTRGWNLDELWIENN